MLVNSKFDAPLASMSLDGFLLRMDPLHPVLEQVARPARRVERVLAQEEQVAAAGAHRLQVVQEGSEVTPTHWRWSIMTSWVLALKQRRMR